MDNFDFRKHDCEKGSSRGKLEEDWCVEGSLQE